MKNKNDLVTETHALLEEEGFTFTKKEVAKVLDTAFVAIPDLVIAEGKLNIAGFGAFEVKETKARKGRNPSTGEEIDIPAGQKPGFKPSKQLKELFK